MLFQIGDLASALENAWHVVDETTPEFLEVGLLRGQGQEDLVWLAVELWGEGSRLSVRKEKVRKRLGAAAKALEGPSIATASASTLGLHTVHGNLSKQASLPSLVSMLEAAGPDVVLRVRGFLDGHVCVIAGGAGHNLPLGASTRAMHSSAAGERILQAIARELDPAGTLTLVPSLWE